MRYSSEVRSADREDKKFLWMGYATHTIVCPSIEDYCERTNLAFVSHMYQ